MYKSNEIDWIKFLKQKKVYIFGFGKLGKNCAFRLRKQEVIVKGFIDNDTKKIGKSGEDEIISLLEYKKRNTTDSMIVICSKSEREIKYQLLSEGIYNYLSIEQIDFGGGENYYDEEYFKWQMPMGKFGAKISYRLFEPYVSPMDVLVEFGSAGGYLLNEFSNKEKVGIEVNDVARSYAKKNGIYSVRTSEELEEEYADTIISTHVLEHTERPLDELRGLYRVLKTGGKIIFYVPNESCETEYIRSEVNNHLYTWNCLNIGNLFKAAGFFVESVECISEIWPQNWQKLGSELSEELFDEISRLGGVATGENNCLIVASK